MSPFVWHGNYYIPLSGVHGLGFFAIVDEADSNLVSGKDWYVTAGGYAAHKMVPLHKLIISEPGFVDHINHNKLDNRRSNLRLVSQKDNNKNLARRSHSRWPYKGVRMTPSGSWHARIRVNRKEVYIGAFDSDIEAAKAYDLAAKQFHGEFAYLNFPEEKDV